MSVKGWNWGGLEWNTMQAPGSCTGVRNIIPMQKQGLPIVQKYAVILQNNLLVIYSDSNANERLAILESSSVFLKGHFPSSFGCMLLFCSSKFKEPRKVLKWKRIKVCFVSCICFNKFFSLCVGTGVPTHAPRSFSESLS